MKILMVNKFLYPKGGSETYIIKLGKYMNNMGHEVQYFGMQDDRNIVGNKSNIYTNNLDFHTGKFKKFIYPFKIVYSFEARQKIRKILDAFKPDIVHLNNINFQITPSIIYEIKKNKIPIIMTVHDPQIICPNHRLYINNRREICERCLKGNYLECIKYKCFNNSKIKSTIGAIESILYHYLRTYDLIDLFICPSNFMKHMLIKGGINKSKIYTLYNFSEKYDNINIFEKENYVLYFGRISYEKGIKTLLTVCSFLKNIKFIFAGSGPMEEELKSIDNIKYVGFKRGNELIDLIKKALFTIYPSEGYENCPLSIIESQSLGTPVIGSNIGGIPELIKDKQTGLLFMSGNSNDLKDKILELYNNRDEIMTMSKNCINQKNNSIENYYNNIIKIYNTKLKNAI